MSAAEAVRLTWLEGGIAVVAMEDRAAKNSFSDAISKGIDHAFATIAANPEARVAVLHGYDSYFSRGGTRDQLIDIANGKIKYTDFTFFDALRRCDLPTIAAMQGHAIGGGLALGLHGDFQIFSEESLYTANFMDYGFTPGMGCTFTVPRTFGEALGWEMLFSGGNYRGAELRQRGAPITACPRSDVVACALERARALATKTPQALKELKRRRREITQADFELAVRREVEMHKVTFAIPTVQERIRTLFREQSAPP